MLKKIIHLGLFLAVLTAMFVFSACRRTHEVTYRVILPDGYVGWVRIDFGANAPLPTDSRDTATFKVGDDGKLWSEAVMVYTVPTHYEFFYETANGLRPIRDDYVDHRLNAGGIAARSDNTRGGSVWYFFIGPKSYREQHTTQDSVSHRLPLPTTGRTGN
jgi:hypothetical protein